MPPWRDILSRLWPWSPRNRAKASQEHVREAADPLTATSPHDGPISCEDWGASPFAAPDVMRYVLHPVPYLDDSEAAERVAALMRLTKPDEWTRLYSAFRGLNIRRRDVSRLASHPVDTATELLGAASVNHDGFVRQEAIEALTRLGHPRALPYILLRLSDWVSEVRQVAELAFGETLRRGLASEFFRYTFLVETLERVERVDLSRIRNRIASFLRGEGGRKELEANLAATDAGVRLFCYHVLVPELVDRPDLIGKAVDDSDPRIRRWIARFLLDNSVAGAGKWLRELLRDRCARVQTDVIRRMSPQVRDELSEAFCELIFADSPSVRGAARFVSRRDGQIDFPAAYRERVSNATNENVCPGWIAGLGETGTRADYTLVQGFLDHLRSKVRAAALAASMRLDRERGLPTALRCLNDPSGKIRRTAVGALAASRTPEIITEADRVLRTGTPKGRVAALAVLVRQGGWDVIPYILNALSQGDEALAQAAWQGMARWCATYFCRGWVKPSEQVLTEIEKGLTILKSLGVQPPPELARAWRDLDSMIAQGKKVWRGG